MKKYSIILPVHNGGEHFKECVKSVLDQKLNDFNLIVLDNKSTDTSIQWLRGLNDERVVIHQSDQFLNIEQSWARIKHIQRGDFMTMIGHDDLLYPNYLQVMDDLIRKYPSATLYQAHFKYIDEKGKLIRHSQPMAEKQLAHEFLTSQMTRKIDSTGTGYMMRSVDYNAAGGLNPAYPNLIFADYELWVKIILKGFKVTAGDECFAYRVHKSASTITNGMVYQQAFFQYMEFIKGVGKSNEINEVIKLYGHGFLMYYCQSLSHRLLKTPVELRTLKVKDLIRKFISLSAEMIPMQKFDPMKKFRINIAEKLDRSGLGRFIFSLYQKIK